MTVIECRAPEVILEDAMFELHARLLRVRFIDGTFSGRTPELRFKRLNTFAMVERAILAGKHLGLYGNACRACLLAYSCEV